MSPEDRDSLTPDEVSAVRVMIEQFRRHCGGGEDVIGAILYSGAFHRLAGGDGAVVLLAEKLEASDEEKNPKPRRA